jgi:hypothetical protein
VTTSSLALENISWYGDSCCIEIKKHKGDQGGDRKIKAHCYSNIKDPELDLFLAFGK